MFRSIKRTASFLLIVMYSIGCQQATNNDTQVSTENDLKSQVFSLEDAQVIQESFGTINLFTNGSASTYGAKDVTTGILNILPNNEAHPPHKHVEEEYLLVTKGTGTWSINGEEFSAKPGDLLYAAPWDMHGIFNSDTVDLEFYFVKWNNKGVPSPVEK